MEVHMTNKKTSRIEKFYTVSEIAKMTGKSEGRIRAEIKQGHFPNAAPPTGWLIPQADLDAYMRGNFIDRRRKL